MNSPAISLVEFCLNLLRGYLLIGFVFAIVFVIFLVPRVDEGAKGGTIGFRLLIIPGVTVFWPLFVLRLLRGKTKPTERTAHRLQALQSTENSQIGG